jgi:hypothetical protein
MVMAVIPSGVEVLPKAELAKELAMPEIIPVIWFADAAAAADVLSCSGGAADDIVTWGSCELLSKLAG